MKILFFLYIILIPIYSNKFDHINRAHYPSSVVTVVKSEPSTFQNSKYLIIT